MQHIRPLDGFRALAILIVFIAHCGLEKYIPGGFGVTIFFFLSGYLITTLLRTEVSVTGRVDLVAFFIRRTLRIWPPLWITSALTILMMQFIPSDRTIDLAGVLVQMAFLTNYASELHLPNGVAIPLWSLAVEEHFYLVFPVLFGLAQRRASPRSIAMGCVAACAVVLAIRIILAFSIENIGDIYYWSHTRIDSILFGCCLALWQNPAVDGDAWKPRPSQAVGALFVLFLCLAIRNEIFRQTLRYTFQGCALFVLFSYAISDRGWVANVLSSAVARKISLYSYTIYLAHVPIITALGYLLPNLPIIGLVITAGVLSVIYAGIMYKLVELPAARIRRSITNKGNRPATIT